MSLLTPINAGGNFATSDIESLKGKKGDSLDQEKARLQRAAKEFESLFMYQMLKEMRKTVSESPLSKDLPMSGSLGKDTFMDLFDVKLSREMASGGRGSISEMLYTSLVKMVEAEYNGSDQPVEIRPLDRTKDQPFIPKSHNLPLEQPGRRPTTLPQAPTQLRRTPRRLETDSVPVRESVTNSGDAAAGTKTVHPQAKLTDPIRRKYGRLIDEAAETHQLDSALIAAVIKTESNGDRTAVSPAGAKGLMQLTDSTAAEMGARRVFNARDNILSGAKYLKKMIDRFGDLKLALAAYNAGPGAVARHQGVPPYRETATYIDKVMTAFEQYKAAAPPAAPKGS